VYIKNVADVIGGVAEGNIGLRHSGLRGEGAGAKKKAAEEQAEGGSKHCLYRM